MGAKTMKKYSAQEKFTTVFESYVTGDLTGTATRHGIHINMLSKWRTQLKANGAKIFERGAGNGKGVEASRLEQLEKIIGRQAIQIDFLKKVDELLG